MFTRKPTRAMFAAGVALAMFTAAPALAGDGNKKHDKNRQASARHCEHCGQKMQAKHDKMHKKHKQAKEQKQSRDQQVSLKDVHQQVEGQLIAVRTINLAGQDEPHVLAKVQQDDGQICVMDLGPVGNLEARNVRLSQGMEMKAMGQPGRINDKPVLIVDRFLGDGAFTMLIPVSEQEIKQARKQHKQQNQRQAQRNQKQNQQARDWRSQRDQQRSQNWRSKRKQQQADAQGNQDQRSARRNQSLGSFERQQAQRSEKVFVTGQLTDMRNIRVQGESIDRNLVKVETDQGRTFIIDLGSSKLESLNLERGDEVAISGSIGRINGKPVIMANTLAEVANIDRSSQQQNQQQRRQR